MRLHIFKTRKPTLKISFITVNLFYGKPLVYSKHITLNEKGYPTQIEAREKNIKTNIMTKYQSRKLPIAPHESSFWHRSSWFGMVKLKGMGGGSTSQNKEKRSPMMASCVRNKTCSQGERLVGSTSLHVYDNFLGNLLWHILQQL